MDKKKTFNPKQRLQSYIKTVERVHGLEIGNLIKRYERTPKTREQKQDKMRQEFHSAASPEAEHKETRPKQQTRPGKIKFDHQNFSTVITYHKKQMQQ